MPSSNIKSKNKSLRTDEAEAKGVGFPKIIIFWVDLNQVNVRLAQNGSKEEIKNL